MKHPNKAVRVFEYGIAAYPLKYKTSVISPQKICLQFSDVQCKTRPLGKDQKNLRKSGKGSKEMPIDTQGTNIDTLAVGIPLHLYPETIRRFWEAVKEHHELYPQYSIKENILDIFKGE